MPTGHALKVYLALMLYVGIASSKWLTSRASLSCPIPIGKAFDLYSQLDQHPSWSPWLKSVEYDADSGKSFWTLSSLGLTYSWNAQNVRMQPPHTIEWESLDGLPNRGRVDFSSDICMSGAQTQNYNVDTEVTNIKLTLCYDLPEAAAFALQALGPIGKTFITKTLTRDLKRFQHRIEKELLEDIS